MPFWILLLGALGVLWMQWVVISMAALGALRRRVQEAFAEIAGPMRRFSEEAVGSGEIARGFGVDAGPLRKLQESRVALDSVLARMTAKTPDAVRVHECLEAWAQMVAATELVNVLVAQLSGVVEGWAALQVELAVCRGRVEQAGLRYNEAVGNYEGRRCVAGMPWVARKFGFVAGETLELPHAAEGEVDPRSGDSFGFGHAV